MDKKLMSFRLSERAFDILEEARWKLRKSKTQIVEALIIDHLGPLVEKDDNASSSRKRGTKKR